MFSSNRINKSLLSILCVFLFLGHIHNVQSLSVANDEVKLNRSIRQVETTVATNESTTTPATTTAAVITGSTTTAVTTTTGTADTTTTTITTEAPTTPTTTTSSTTTTTTASTIKAGAADTTATTTTALTDSKTTAGTSTTSSTTTTVKTKPSIHNLLKTGDINLLQKLQSSYKNKPTFTKWTTVPTLVPPTKKHILQQIINKRINWINKTKVTSREAGALDDGDDDNSGAEVENDAVTTSPQKSQKEH